MDIVYRNLKQHHGREVPEFRIPLILPGGLLGPAGIVAYGWAAHQLAPWPVVDLGAFIFSFSSQMGTQAEQAYIIDSYPDHTSSATAALQFLRSMTAFAFPLFAPSLYRALGYGWGNTIIALAWWCIALPATVLLWLYGSNLRAKAQSSY